MTSPAAPDEREVVRTDSAPEHDEKDTVRTKSEPTPSDADFVRTKSLPPTSDGDFQGYETCSKRLEIRVRPSELTKWKALAAEHGMCMTELVGAALNFAVADMPVVLAALEQRQRLEREQWERPVARGNRSLERRWQPPSLLPAHLR